MRWCTSHSAVPAPDCQSSITQPGTSPAPVVASSRSMTRGAPPAGSSSSGAGAAALRHSAAAGEGRSSDSASPMSVVSARSAMVSLTR